MLDSLALALTILLIVLALFTAALRVQYRQAGERLLILSRFKLGRSLWFVFGTAIIIWGIYRGNATIIWGFNAIGLNFYIQFFCPTELREHGIINSGSFIRWSQIKSYQLEQGSKHAILKLKSKNWHRRWKIRVSHKKRFFVEQILQSKLDENF